MIAIFNAVFSFLLVGSRRFAPCVHFEQTRAGGHTGKGEGEHPLALLFYHVYRGKVQHCRVEVGGNPAISPPFSLFDDSELRLPVRLLLFGWIFLLPAGQRLPDVPHGKAPACHGGNHVLAPACRQLAAITAAQQLIYRIGGAFLFKKLLQNLSGDLPVHTLFRQMSPDLGRAFMAGQQVFGPVAGKGLIIDQPKLHAAGHSCGCCVVILQLFAHLVVQLAAGMIPQRKVFHGLVQCAAVGFVLLFKQHRLSPRP